jgi:hypothetical protein
MCSLTVVQSAKTVITNMKSFVMVLQTTKKCSRLQCNIYIRLLRQHFGGPPKTNWHACVTVRTKFWLWGSMYVQNPDNFKWNFGKCMCQDPDNFGLARTSVSLFGQFLWGSDWIWPLGIGTHHSSWQLKAIHLSYVRDIHFFSTKWNQSWNDNGALDVISFLKNICNIPMRLLNLLNNYVHLSKRKTVEQHHNMSEFWVHAILNKWNRDPQACEYALHSNISDYKKSLVIREKTAMTSRYCYFC